MDVKIPPSPPRTAAQQFGEQIAFYRRQSIDPRKGGPLSQQRLGELLEEIAGVAGYDSKRLSRWETAKDTISHENRELLVGLARVFHHCGGMTERATADQFLTLGQYSPLTKEEATTINPAWQAPPVPPPPPFASRNILIPLDELLATARQSLPYPEEHLRTPRGLVIWLLRGLEHLPWVGFITAALLWFTAYQLLHPALHWPIPDWQARMGAYGGFALAHLFIPLALAWLITPDGYEQFAPSDGRERRRLFFLKWVGALVGFTMVTLALWLGGLLLFYAGADWPRLWLVGAGVALLIAYVSGGRIPIDRYKMFEGKLRTHPVDIFFAAVFLCVPILLMGFVGISHDLLANPRFGGAAAVVIGGTILWIRRDKEAPYLSDGAMFWLTAVVFPLLAFWFLRLEFLPPYPPTLAEWGMMALALAYVFCFWVYWVALSLWRPRPATWRVVRQIGLGLAVLIGGIASSWWLFGQEILWGSLGLLGVVVAAVVGSVYRGRG